MSPYLHAAWESVAQRSPITFDDFLSEFAGADAYPVSVDGKPVGAVIVVGPEVHACISGGYGRWFKREHFLILRALIEVYGYAQTRVTTPAGEAFVRRLGFVPCGEVWRLYGN